MRLTMGIMISLLLCGTRIAPPIKSAPVHMDQVRFQYAMMQEGDSLLGGMYNILYYFTDTLNNRKGVYSLVCMLDHTSGEYIYRGVSKSYHSDSIPKNFPDKVEFNSEYTWKFKGNKSLTFKANPNEKSKLKIKASVYHEFPGEKTVYKNQLVVCQYQRSMIKMKVNNNPLKATRELHELSFTEANRFLYEEHKKIIISFSDGDTFLQVNGYLNEKGEPETNLGATYELTSDTHTSTNGTLYLNIDGNPAMSTVEQAYGCTWNITDPEKKTDVLITPLPEKQVVRFYKKSFWIGFARVNGRVNGKPFKGYASVIMN